ncbi:IS3 family transposase, partial [Brachybacterium paraconglomeratum]|uniref:IS3 family transposase n=1 Tax=Brachybacterium paraconglomeratum TaxID=173362 RepID=UPI0022C4DAC7|nr:hypothetical protein [Brachybacterium paraconglomeratum]
KRGQDIQRDPTLPQALHQPPDLPITRSCPPRPGRRRRGTCEPLTNPGRFTFFALLQKNVLDRKRWRTREELRIAIITWIERTYHRRRRQARLGRLTPIEFETIMNQTVSLAA